MHEDDNTIIGTPKDYSDTLYKYYLEVAEHEQMAFDTIKELFGMDRLHLITPIDHGYEIIMPIQLAPDLLRNLLNKNLAIYQLVRFAKTSGRWDQRN
ncbi:MAG: hypothetical protein ABJO86_02070 [Lentilitoribacter sp.]